ncbi:glycosyltransferase family 2 protein [Pyrobaculum neutrophilum]|uniref:Glycosyl transferase family 2 n=1 Tax=Pyrobaculum neutrophilum (strain DSM 2338 / JCM 9278 / NBRC 100436 / V24Sta) TaxID=444157 RepID=B1YCE4_PYRNV|nr:glycosyltransferase [Pyrobaculum neutrophilum]ACB39457.1 glycosyl transferase family 2 [Pyrobaculum neutrophilum V24Sta]
MVVVAMITKNSLSRLGDRLGVVLESTLQIPYRTFVLVDDSTDDTAKYVEGRLGGLREVVVLRSRAARPTRATARQAAVDYFLQYTSDEWLMFIDDDVVLRSGWWEEAQRYMAEPRVGLIWGVDFTTYWGSRLAYLRARGVDVVEYAIKRFNVRGGLHDTLLRRGAIEGLRLPPWLNVYEDAWVKKYVECRGFEARVVRTGADHLRAEGGSGYSAKDFLLASYVDGILRLEGVTYLSLLKSLLGLPAYLYYGWRSGYGGLEQWRARVVYKYNALRARRRCRWETCRLLLDPDLHEELARCLPREVTA